jgi:uncharacterized repeat protein (TIGR03847 family)
MGRRVFEHDPPDRFVAGTVGRPGERTFFLQAVSGETVHTVVCEKEQVRLLAERMQEVLDETLASDPLADIPPQTPPDMLGLQSLTPPLEPEFRVAALALGWNRATHRLVVEAHAALTEGEDVPDLETDDPGHPDVLRVRLTGTAARAFAEHALQVVAAGRPDCPFCHQPLDPVGHICPRSNGYRR